jgi:uncharacterized HAD superfamily protein/hypoxanthine phosphoribosyltransferase
MLTVRSVTDLTQAIAANLHRIDRSSFDVVVGIPRSGMIPAAIIATHLQMPLADVGGYAKGIVNGRGGKGIATAERVLLVDDSVNQGRAMATAAAIVKQRARSVTRLAIFGPYKPEAAHAVDVAFADCPGPRVFAWNMAKHKRLGRWGMDFDGVLCRDNTNAENDDGPRYEAFVAGAEPLFLPRRPVGHIVTCRLEKYRAATEAWLQRHGVEFGQLHMMPFETKAERMAAGNRGGWKAGIVREIGVEMFIESCPKQAGIIARKAGVPVWCARTQEVIRA